MGALIKTESVGLQLMTTSFGGPAPQLPFASEFLLLEARVAGAAHYQAGAVRDGLVKGTPLRLRRQPTNEKDALAIEVLATSGEKLGFVPRRDNPVLARLLDAGKPLTAYVVDVEPMGHWTAIDIRVCMKNY